MNTDHVPTSWRFVSRDSSATNAVTWRRKSNRTARAAYKANVFTAGMSVIAPKRQTSVKGTCITVEQNVDQWRVGDYYDGGIPKIVCILTCINVLELCANVQRRG